MPPASASIGTRYPGRCDQGGSFRSAMRRGFSLLELMVVLMVVALVLGLAVGGILTLPQTQGLKGAEQTLASLVRQARHTALSTGAPVELQLARPTDPGTAATITGISQVVVAVDDFERHEEIPEPDGEEQRRELGDTPTPLPGLAGFGWRADHDGDPAGGGYDRALPLLEKRVLMRRDGDGFYLSCWVKPPLPIDSADHGLPYFMAPLPSTEGEPVRWLPLVLIAPAEPDLPAPGTGSDPTFAGLGLELRAMTMDNGVTASKAYHWVPVGWVGDATDADRRVEGFIPDTTRPFPSSSGHSNAAHPIPGERWVQLGLLYDGDELRLFRDEVPIAAKTISTPVVAPNSTEELLLHMGYVQDGGGSIRRSPALLDSVRLLRLGADRPVDLPKNVAPDADYRITFDGSSVQLTRDGTAVNQITLRSRQDPRRWASIAIGPTGTVTSKVHYDPDA